jgi:pimeloyl-ACP methyl ester carboxylesterase
MTARVDYAFLHGGGQGGWVWGATIAALRQQAQGDAGRVLALDVPGCGTKRGRDTKDIGVAEIAAELVADIATMGLREVVLVGHSQAGSIMPHILGLQPELFRRAVFLTCSIPLPGQTVIEMMGSGPHGANPDEVGWPLDPKTHSAEQRAEKMFCNDMSPAQAAEFNLAQGADAWPMASYTHTDWRQEELGAVPASYVICLRDGILPVPWQETFAGRFKAERLVRLDCGHQAMTTRPQALAEILRHEAG